MEENIIKNVPVIPLRGIVVFPHMNVSFDVGRDKSVRALEAAVDEKQEIFLATQLDSEKDEPKLKDIYNTGVFAVIKQVMRAPGGVTRVIVHGKRRGQIISEDEDGSFYAAYVRECIEQSDPDAAVTEAHLRQLRRCYQEYFTQNNRLSPENYMAVMTSSNLSRVCDIIAASLEISIEKKQELLSELVIENRAQRLMRELKNEANIINLEKQIANKVKVNMDKNQKEYYIREQIKVLREELGDKDGVGEDAAKFREQIGKLKASKEVKEKLLKEVERFERTPASTPESAGVRNYLDTVLELPWNKRTKETFDIKEARRILDEDHYGLEKVKERIIEYLSVRQLTKGQSGTILCLSGPPGVGKTSVAKSVARALNRKYVRISLGGIHDESDIRGHRRTYLGSMEGRIMMAMKEAKSKNPLVLLDEIDKMGVDYKGDPSAALLEVLDMEQNYAFRDHYIEVPFDLSQVLYITTANTLETVSRPLLDRMEVIELSGYTETERFNIARRYLVKKTMERNGISPEKLEITDSAIYELIRYYTREAGVRRLEQQLDSLCRKAARHILEDSNKVIIDENNVEEYLGKRKYHFELMNECDQVGIARGLAWTSVGGETLSVEVNVMPGKGEVKLTGKLGDVMKESAMAAISYIRSHSESLEIEKDFYKEKDIHIHVPEGAVPKDGPSAGITMATALVSSLTGRPVKRDVAMTGEITLRGRVLPIGGLKEKSLAAYRAGIKTVIIPDENKPDLEDIPAEVRDHMTFVPVKEMDAVISTALNTIE